MVLICTFEEKRNLFIVKHINITEKHKNVARQHTNFNKFLQIEKVDAFVSYTFLISMGTEKKKSYDPLKTYQEVNK